MSHPAPPEWPRRVIVVEDGAAPVVRGRAAEFLHAGIVLTRVPTASAALIALGDPEGAAAVLVPEDVPGMNVSDFIDIAVGLGRTSVVVGTPPAPVGEPGATLHPGGITVATVALPVTPVRLARALDAVAPREAVAPTTYRLGDVELDASSYRVSWRGRAVRLTPGCFDVLEYLMAASPRVVAVQELASELARAGAPGGTDRIRARVRRIRAEFRAAVPGVAPPLETVQKVGYRVVSPEVAATGGRAARRPVAAG